MSMWFSPLWWLLFDGKYSYYAMRLYEVLRDVDVGNESCRFVVDVRCTCIGGWVWQIGCFQICSLALLESITNFRSFSVMYFSRPIKLENLPIV